MELSDSQSISDAQQYTCHHPQAKQPPKQSPIKKILTQFHQLQKNLVTKRLKKTIAKLIERVDEQKGFKTMNLILSKTGMIFPIKFRKNQEDYLPEFISLLQKELSITGPINTSINQQKLQIFTIPQSQIRQIVLKIFIHLEQKEEKQVELMIFLVDKITDLSQENIYRFEKSLKGKEFIVFIPTFQSLEQEEVFKIVTYDKYHYDLFDPKQLFCDFMYACLQNKIVMAYLPSQVLKILTDMDYYAISFNESCRRFAYCIQKFHMISKKQLVYVQSQQVIDAIEKVIDDTFKVFYNEKIKRKQKILKIILNSQEKFYISQKFLSLIMELDKKNEGSKCQIDEQTLIESIRHKIKKQFGKMKILQPYIEYLEDFDMKGPVKKLKKTDKRMKDLGINPSINLDPRVILERQLTRIIHTATSEIRRQAGYVEWSEINFQLRMKPQIPYIMVQSLLRNDQTQAITKEVTSWYSLPLALVFSKYKEQQLGQVIYIIRVLEVIGVIESNRKLAKPSIFNNFYQKNQFVGKKK